MDRLRRLSLMSVQLSADGVRAIASTAQFARLHELLLERNAIDDAGAVAPWLPGLEKMDLVADFEDYDEDPTLAALRAAAPGLDML
jgi:hypothetical protein